MTLLKSFSLSHLVGTCRRYNKKRKEVDEILCPKIVKNYDEEEGWIFPIRSLHYIAIESTYGL